MVTPHGATPRTCTSTPVPVWDWASFLLLLLPYGAAAGMLLAGSTVVRFPAKAVTVPAKTLPALRMRYVWAYLALFALCLLTVAGVLSKPVVLVIVALPCWCWTGISSGGWITPCW